ncbi:MAG: SulP family inorganic anion transporter [Bacteroidia bacterium]|nr:SulP family inorganic anion transporter [Bacteroidia bacterium]
MNNQSVLSLSTFKDSKQSLKSDMVSGFLVFLIALPLSLGIAKASGFPAAMGVLAAMVGGIFTTFFKVCDLSIKGPAAGLITICSGAIMEFGGGEQGWKMTCAVIVVMAAIQILFAVLKVGSYGDFFPHSAIHGMLAAIGIIIISKQIPVLLGDEPSMYKGESPIALLLDIPRFIVFAHWHIAAIGLLSALIMFGIPFIKKNVIQKIPAPMIALILTIPLSIYWHFKQTEPDYSLVSIGDFWGSMGLHVDFSGITTLVFWKYVFMFLFINSLESLLTVKAVDQLDKTSRKSDPNGDLMGLGFANFLSGLLGGLPIISEVVRSSANIGFGAKTKWSNFFHGIFLLIVMLFLIPVIELIPNATLAAMLIYAGFRLASPKEFAHTYQIGKEQLLVFLITIIVTLAEDLLVGVLTGILVEMIVYFLNGISYRNVFKAQYQIDQNTDETVIHVQGAAIFSNLISFKKILTKLTEKQKVIFDVSQSTLIDHSFMNFIRYFETEYNNGGGNFSVVGLENLQGFSNHKLSGRRKK